MKAEMQFVASLLFCLNNKALFHFFSQPCLHSLIPSADKCPILYLLAFQRI